MAYKLLFCVKLVLLHLCVADLGYQCKDQTIQSRQIILLETDNPIHKLLNREFYEKCSYFYKIHTEPILPYDDILQTLKYIETNERLTVVNLYVPDYYEYNDTRGVQANLTYAGDLINITNTDIKCVTTNKTKWQRDCGDIVKVISKSEITEELYDFVDSFTIIGKNVHARERCPSVLENRTSLKTVLLCMEDEIFENTVKVHIEHLNLIITRMDYCKEKLEYFQNFLAVLASKPFETDSECSIPFVFYKTPYTSPKLEQNFPNSITLGKWQLLKHVIVKFLNLVGWQRLVVVSDDAFYSIEFENELAALFYKERISYTVIRCKESECDLGQVRRSLRYIRARIVIANVEENNANSLIKFNSDSEIVWLLRHTNEAVQEVSEKQRVFTFSLGASVEQSSNCGLNENILDGLSSLSLAYQFMKNKNYTMTKHEFYRQFLKVMKRNRPSESLAYVDVRHYRGSKRISKMHVKNDGAEVISFEDPFKSGNKPIDAPASCIARSSDYFKYCENTLVLFYMFVIILFITTILLITCYFHKSSPFHDIRYQNF